MKLRHIFLFTTLSTCAIQFINLYSAEQTAQMKHLTVLPSELRHKILNHYLTYAITLDYIMYAKDAFPELKQTFPYSIKTASFTNKEWSHFFKNWVSSLTFLKPDEISHFLLHTITDPSYPELRLLPDMPLLIKAVLFYSKSNFSQWIDTTAAKLTDQEKQTIVNYFDHLMHANVIHTLETTGEEAQVLSSSNNLRQDFLTRVLSRLLPVLKLNTNQLGQLHDSAKITGNVRAEKKIWQALALISQPATE
ncbi:hypothetical protein KG892_03420 [Vermiphilus pyriformis]|uniref:Uncharacterized protein n=1 Tax=candidate division TM6 bacterium JCVI TM6SC1 TaxID=1306947 RepID=A0A0D2JKN6_9BACT|nr:hypothetical protein J120_04465 [candidate division TM6 bacterium JCVI TM6SC1]UNE35023.1 MAG: hypothetical protein KG892_03420 [Vermiphilus pyriformis]